MEPESVAVLLDLQCGVISRRQVLEAGGADKDIARCLRRRLWARVHDGVYINHTGQLTHEQRAWAAVLFYWPAALAGGSALLAHGARTTGRRHREQDPVEVAIGHTRSVGRCPGITVTRVVDFDRQAQMNLSPPRLRVEHALLTVASRAPEESVGVGILGDACQQRISTAYRLVKALAHLPRLRRRRLLLTILEDVAAGAYSVLERHYLVHVERPHKLPTGRRQRRVTVGRQVYYRDVDHMGVGAVVELDGRLGHERSADRWADLDRDVEAAVAGALTVRVGWKQALYPCRLAAAIARILIARGWAGTPVGCRPGCPVGAISVDLPSQGG